MAIAGIFVQSKFAYVNPLFYFSQSLLEQPFYYPKKHSSKYPMMVSVFNKDNAFVMHFNEFLQLNETEQVELLWYNGEQIGRRKEDDYLILLYQVEGFYVEVFYHRKERVIKKYLSFDCSDCRLQPYLEKIDISPIYKQIRKPSRYSDLGLVNYFVSIAMDRHQDRKAVHSNADDSRTGGGFWGKILSFFSK